MSYMELWSSLTIANILNTPQITPERDIVFFKGVNPSTGSSQLGGQRIHLCSSVEGVRVRVGKYESWMTAGWAVIMSRTPKCVGPSRGAGEV